jgi:hypothetical protein
LKDISQKTAFLLGLATAKRIGELHALTTDISHKEQWTEVSIAFQPTFLAKTQDPGNPATGSTHLTVLALAPTLEKGLSDRLLCPVRALKFYLARTQPTRGNITQLFLTFGSGTLKPVTKSTLSNWIKDIIRSAHAQSTDEDARLTKCSTHELRALSTSLRFQHSHNLSAIMEAASWRSHNTFSHFYLRDITLTNNHLSSLGPLVACQGIVGERPSKAK